MKVDDKPLPALEKPEIIIGLCSPIGTDTKKIASMIKQIIQSYEYDYIQFKVTDLMKQIKIKDMKLIDAPIDERYNSYINYANKLRKLFSMQYIMSCLCIAAIRSHRRKKDVTENSYVEKTVYLFDQFKRKEEVDILRRVYGRLFILVSVYSDKYIRIQKLTTAIAKSRHKSRPEREDETVAVELVNRDESEFKEYFGQRIKEIFPIADVFVDVDDKDKSKETLERFFSGLFGSNANSPTKDEYGMYLAKSAAFRSSDLSRQVGAAIFSDKGEIISLGSNEVPKASGGTYWSDESLDVRDFQKGYDENDLIKISVLMDLIERLKQEDFLKETKEDINELILKSVKEKGSSLRDSKIMDLLEFGRIIHAEMSAICDSARTGRSILNSTMYCTTFPCHMCAKHVIASGIRRLVYIEPYPKSYADKLHSDAIYVGRKTTNNELVKFEPFIGISPFRYREIFERGKRKNEESEFMQWMDGEPKPIIKFTFATYLQNEQAMTKNFSDASKELENNGEIEIG